MPKGVLSDICFYCHPCHLPRRAEGVVSSLWFVTEVPLPVDLLVRALGFFGGGG